MGSKKDLPLARAESIRMVGVPLGQHEYLTSKRNMRENKGLLLHGKRSLAKGLQRWLRYCTIFFAVFASKSSPQESLTQESRENFWRKKDSSAKEDRVRDRLVKFDIHKSMDSDGMQPQVVRNCQRSWLNHLSKIMAVRRDA